MHCAEHSRKSYASERPRHLGRLPDAAEHSFVDQVDQDPAPLPTLQDHQMFPTAWPLLRSPFNYHCHPSDSSHPHPPDSHRHRLSCLGIIINNPSKPSTHLTKGRLPSRLMASRLSLRVATTGPSRLSSSRTVSGHPCHAPKRERASELLMGHVPNPLLRWQTFCLANSRPSQTTDDCVANARLCHTSGQST